MTAPLVEDSDELKLKDVETPGDTDVLCGRGGAALRHPGNQTYRRLVNLNKGLYITCLKAEKLKISRSIVAAIREQNGRFLEKNQSKGTWYDIGDKKAIEKTSQALREGQPKLRQQIVELGGGAAGAAALLERQFPGGGSSIYNTLQQQQQQQQLQQQQQQQRKLELMQQQQQQQLNAAVPTTLETQSSRQMMPPPQSRSSANSTTSDFTPADLMQRLSSNLSLQEIQEDPNTNAAAAALKFQNDLRPSLTQRGSGVAEQLGVPSSNRSLMSQISILTSDDANINVSNTALAAARASFNSTDIPPPPSGTPGSLMGMSIGSINMTPTQYHHHLQQQQQIQQQQEANHPGANGLMASTFGTPSSNASGGMDRRKHFRDMKYVRPPSFRAGSKRELFASQKSINDDMPEIHGIGSNPSLLSGISLISGPGVMNSLTSGSGAALSRAAVNASAQAIPSEVGTALSQQQQQNNIFESRRSVMSGLSKISDTSGADTSIFSDLSKKIGNVSTRSLPMSEISAFDDGGELTDTNSIDTARLLSVATSTGDDTATHGSQQSMDFDDDVIVGGL